LHFEYNNCHEEHSTMLSASSRPLIQASVPVLREHGPRIARTFYANMFAAHPELQNVFNMGNQAQGTQQQVLSGALLAYAANIDNLAAILPVVRRIAHKHASVGVKPAHYPIVARHLLGAIKEVLGAAATTDLLAAWDEAYWLLAGELIAAEARVYERASAEALQICVVQRVERESSGVLSCYLERAEGGSPGSFQPGQYVSVAVDLPGSGLRQLRQYSLSDAPSRPYWRLSVKHEQALDGRPEGAVSSHLHGQLYQQQRLLVSAAFGDFTPLAAATDKPIALLCAGIGITPLLSVLNTLAEAGSSRPVLFVHAVREREQLLFTRELQRARARLPGLRSALFCEQLSAESTARHALHAGRMSLSPALLAGFEDADFYMCGPEAFMREQWRALVSRGVSPLKIQREVFGPSLLEQLG
jgi:nitric oxide dioxygenase